MLAAFEFAPTPYHYTTTGLKEDPQVNVGRSYFRGRPASARFCV